MAKKAKKTARGRTLDRRLVAGKQNYEIDFEARYGGKSRPAVKKAVKKAGRSRKKVRKALSR